MDYPLCENANFAFFLNPCLYSLERVLFERERYQILFLGVFCIKRNHNKIFKFLIKPMENCQFCGFLKPMFSLFRKACLLYKTSKIVFLRFILTFYYMGIEGFTWGYRGLQGVTGGFKGLQGVTKDYRNFFLTRTFPDTFSWSISHKNQS